MLYDLITLVLEIAIQIVEFLKENEALLPFMAKTEKLD